jgi:hypothetical protein
MLTALKNILRKKPVVETGQTIFKMLWIRLKSKVCDDWNLCEKWKPSDPALILALWLFIRRNQPVSEHNILLVFTILLVRLGPETLCDCSNREKTTKAGWEKTPKAHPPFSRT